MADDRAVESADYHSLSVLAIISLVIGIAAPLCLLAPLLWAVPLFGVAVALVALRHIASSDGVLVGRVAAVVGLALCVGAMAAAATRTWSVEYLRTRQAAATGSRWIELLQTGRIPQAYGLTVGEGEAPSRRGRDGEVEPVVDPVAEFTAKPAVAALVSAGDQARVRFERNLSYEPGPSGLCTIEQRYVVAPSGDQAGQPPIAIRLKLQRGYVSGEPQLQWLIRTCEFDDSAPAGGDRAG